MVYLTPHANSHRFPEVLSPMIDPIDVVADALSEAARVKRAMHELAPQIVRVAGLIAEAYRQDQRLYACGNGGSACDAMHLVEELVARYKLERPGLAAHHLLDAPTLTCWSNDYDFNDVFARQVEALVRAGDIFIAISTSGDSENVVRAVEEANSRGAITVGLSGRDGGRMRDLCTELLIVPAQATERIQEGHITIIHLLCELVERSLFGDLKADHSASTNL